MTRGFVDAGFEPVLALDNDPWAVLTHKINFGSEHSFVADLTDGRPEYPQADVLIGGPPCQGFSQLGKNHPNHPLNSMWRHYLDAIELIKPDVFVMENVPQLLTSPHYFEFQQSLPRGYNIKGAVLNSADFGVPQNRRRAIVIGSTGVSADDLFPVPDHGDPASLFTTEPWKTVESALQGIPLNPIHRSDSTWDRFKAKSGSRLHVARHPTEVSLARYRVIPPGGNRFDLQRTLPELTPPCWVRKKSGGTDLFGRLWWDRPSVTIRTEFFKPEKGRYLHPSEDRPITIWEAARMQTIPDDFLFLGAKTAVARQIGNAVPPLFARKIAERIAGVLGGLNPKFIDSQIRDSVAV